MKSLALAASVLVLGLSSTAGATSVRRFAVIVGSNDGGPDRPALRFAASDAESMMRVLEELGGVQRDDATLLVAPSRAQLIGVLEGLRPRLADAQQRKSRVELLVYFSGHSDENGLLLGPTSYGYAELRGELESLPADVRIAILDSCASGAMTRLKGGVHRPPFLLDASEQVKGHAFITSSSEDEAAQESDRVGGSFFTHYFVSALRGAADTSHDGRVTLNEAYHFAFQETLARTERTRSGPQHPAYDIELTGTGDLVMTDLHGTSAGLVLTDRLVGRIFVRDDAGRLVVELDKTPGRPAELGLEAGRYRVLVDHNGHIAQASVTLLDDKIVELSPGEFGSVAPELTVARGKETRLGFRAVPFNVALAPRLGINGREEARVRNYFSLGLPGAGSGRSEGAQVSLLFNWVDQDAVGLQAAAGINVTREDVRGLQAAGLGNWAGGEVRGVQDGTLFNVAAGGLSGLQATAGVNVVTGDLAGLQAAALVNVATEHVGGFQVSAVANSARLLDGLQATVLVNEVSELRGVQLGLVNVAHAAHGLQLGLINIADESDVPLGLINIVRGGFHFEIWGSELTAMNVGLRMGGKVFHTLLGVGFQPGPTTQRTATAGLGVTFLPSQPVSLNLELLEAAVFTGKPWAPTMLVHTLRLGVDWHFSKPIALVIGPSFNMSNGLTAENPRQVPRLTVSKASPLADRLSYWPGAFIGLEL